MNENSNNSDLLLEQPFTRMSSDQVRGTFLGLTIGDALGAYLEFSEKREPENYLREYKVGGPHRLEAGYWNDDTSMALAIADSLQLSRGKFDPHITMRNFYDLYGKGAFSSTGDCFDIGMTCQEALRLYEKDPSNPYVGSTAEYSSGYGTIMRIAPVVITAITEGDAVNCALLQTRLTHGSNECHLFSEIYARELWHSMAVPEYEEFRIARETPREEVQNSGYVRHTYEAAWWCVQNTESFEAAVIEAVNLGGDSDTIGAVTGPIAGRIFGVSSIAP